MKNAQILNRLEEAAKDHADGHLTIMRFTGNWRVGFYTPLDRCDICVMPSGKTFQEAAEKALADPSFMGFDYHEGTCPCGLMP